MTATNFVPRVGKYDVPILLRLAENESSIHRIRDEIGDIVVKGLVVARICLWNQNDFTVEIDGFADEAVSVIIENH